ncbi:MAG: hypothetical protein ABIC95_05740 [archaeon]
MVDDDLISGAENLLEGLGALLEGAGMPKGQQGRDTAIKDIEFKIARGPEVIAAVKRQAFDFSEYQELNLFSPEGYFEKRVDYKDRMLLLPHLLAPHFGKSMGELLFATYVSDSYIYPRDLIFLSLSAGSGDLDLDLIGHVTREDFADPDYPGYGAKMRDQAKFLITDRPETALARLADQLKPHLKNEKLNDRISITKLNPSAFRLDKSPMGLVYANDLVANMATEPIISWKDQLYCVKLMPHIHYQQNDTGEDIKTISKHMSISGLVTKKRARKMITDGNANHLGAYPILIPLEEDAALNDKIDRYGDIQNIDSEDYGGIYPIHMGLDGMFSSVRDSFEKGSIILINAKSAGKGAQNWNNAINQYKSHYFGRDDIDFRVAPEQIINTARNHSIKHEHTLNLQEYLMSTLPQMQRWDQKDFDRFFSLSSNHRLPGDQLMVAGVQYATMMLMAKTYDIQCFSFS